MTYMRGIGDMYLESAYVFTRWLRGALILSPVRWDVG